MAVRVGHIYILNLKERTMNYLGIDVHSRTSTWCLLNPQGEICGRGRVPTTEAGLTDLVAEAGAKERFCAGQEVGSYAYFVYDTFSDLGVDIVSFNAQHLKMIASSRKKSDRRDAYWIAKSIQTGMMPHPVYIPAGDQRELRQRLARRERVKRDRNRLVLRVRGLLKSLGLRPEPRVAGVKAFLLNHVDSLPAFYVETLRFYGQQIDVLEETLKRFDRDIQDATRNIDAVRRLMTIPGIGWLSGATIYAWVADIARFPSARHLASYAGLVPTVRQSGQSNYLGHITKQGSPQLRALLIQCAQTVSISRSVQAAGLRDTFGRVRKTRGRYKIAVVALARHLLRIAYYVLRDDTEFDPRRVLK